MRVGQYRQAGTASSISLRTSDMKPPEQPIRIDQYRGRRRWNEKTNVKGALSISAKTRRLLSAFVSCRVAVVGEVGDGGYSTDADGFLTGGGRAMVEVAEGRAKVV